ncbi:MULTISPECIES: DUF5304 domain-containing protein [Streptomyces]|uniref:DUF5304 domain-containing protein n=2 Tax=Streptomyces TaxID=1883 RepID=A0ABU2RMW8_9ACTN|nr:MULTISPECIES: DUF5304 domain-containing protein [unclassified Streptomyces]MBK3592766.1 DUF5304 domain-containing protein [Streptomyces sp. MBT51]MDT0430208.1 DUF5304 domain-containing protein [Streptomyces sp. DSM 41770]HBF85546.1 hypothetical protein [Streptomyces sp.]
MSEATDRPADDDAWAQACAEDLEAEKARRRAEYGPPPGSAAEELRKLFDAVADKVSSLQSPLLGAAAQGTVQQVIRQAKSAVGPVIERNPGVFDHLAAAGNELLAAYRSAVEGQEGRWTQGTEGASGTTRPASGTAPDPTGPAGKAAQDPSDPRDEGPGGSEHIDLD